MGGFSAPAAAVAAISVAGGLLVAWTLTDLLAVVLVASAAGGSQRLGERVGHDGMIGPNSCCWVARSCTHGRGSCGAAFPGCSLRKQCRLESLHHKPRP